MSFVENLKFKVWDYMDYRKCRKAHNKAKALVRFLNKKNYKKYSLTPESENWKLDFTAK